MTQHLSLLQASVIGASGYTGAELIRLLCQHPQVKISKLVGDSSAGQSMGAIYSHFQQSELPDIVKFEDADFSTDDVVFCCLPHATTHAYALKLPDHVVLIDVSADFRLKDPAQYEHWYGHEHGAPQLQKEAVYGLSEIYREQIAQARLIACPGCYPTSMLLPLYPLLQRRLIRSTPIIVDAKSGITGAGRSAKTANLFTEVNESVRPYSIGGHRHVAEVEQSLTEAYGAPLTISFTPQVVPQSRGILSCIYVSLADQVSVSDLAYALTAFYQTASCVQVMRDAPQTRDVYATNLCRISVHADRIPGQAILISVIDNLVKGASGQAIQNMNIRFGLPETTGLPLMAVFP